MRTVIIGGSAAGMGVAAKLSRLKPNDEIIVVQNKDYISLGACGLPYFISNNFDDPTTLLARHPKDFANTNVKIINNTLIDHVEFENKEVCYGSNKLKYDNLVIAVGAKPIIPPIKGTSAKNVFTLTTLEDAINLKQKLNEFQTIKKVAIIGAGFIGLEVCEALHALKKEIFIVEMEKNISSKVFDKEFSEMLLDDLKTKSINVLLETKLTEIINKNGKVCGIILDNKEIIDVDMVIMAVGFEPNTKFLRSTALNFESNGAIIVNGKGETNITNVYAAGDCATSKNVITSENMYSPLATVAAKFARVIADNIAGKTSEFVGTMRSAMLRVFEHEYARTGLSENEARQKNIDIKTVFIKDKDQTNYVSGQQDLYLKLILDVSKNILIGAQMCGSNHSILRINAIATMIWLKANVDEILAQIDLPYAPPFSRTTDILHIALTKLLK